MGLEDCHGVAYPESWTDREIERGREREAMMESVWACKNAGLVTTTIKCLPSLSVLMI